jgi:hypothetical protein
MVRIGPPRRLEPAKPEISGSGSDEFAVYQHVELGARTLGQTGFNPETIAYVGGETRRLLVVPSHVAIENLHFHFVNSRVRTRIGTFIVSSRGLDR